MQPISKFAIVATLGVALAACQTTGDGAPAKNSLEETVSLGGVKQTNADHKALRSQPYKRGYKTATGGEGIYVSHPDGRIEVDWGKGSDTGTWAIKGDTVCSTWKTIREGKERCFVSYAMPDGTYRSYVATSMKYNSTSWAVE